MDLSGRYLPLSAKYTVNLGINYEAPVAGGTLAVSPSLYFNSGYFNESDNIAEQESFTQLGVTVKWTSPDEHFSIGAFGKNLTNKRILSYASTQANNGAVSAVYSAPRTYGVTVGAKF